MLWTVAKNDVLRLNQMFPAGVSVQAGPGYATLKFANETDYVLFGMKYVLGDEKLVLPAINKTTRLHVNIQDHPKACSWHNFKSQVPRVKINDEAKAWLKENAKGPYLTGMSGAANIIAWIEFVNANDAVLFKMFWM